MAGRNAGVGPEPRTCWSQSAFAAALADRLERGPRPLIAAARDILIEGCSPGCPAHPHRIAPRAPAGARLVLLSGHRGEAVLLELERRGIVCSSGSACAVGSDEPSPALVAVGIAPEVAQTAVRFSFGSGFDAAVAERVVAEVTAAVAAVSSMARRYPGLNV